MTRFSRQNPVSLKQLNEMARDIDAIKRSLGINRSAGTSGDFDVEDKAPHRQRWFRIMTDDDMAEYPVAGEINDETENRLIARDYVKCSGGTAVRDAIPAMWAKENTLIRCDFVYKDTGRKADLLFFPWLSYITAGTTALAPEEAIVKSIGLFLKDKRVLASFNRGSGRWEAAVDDVWSMHAAVSVADIERNTFGNVRLAANAGAVFTAAWGISSHELSVYNGRDKIWNGSPCYVDICSLSDGGTTTKLAGVVRSAWSATMIYGTSTGTAAPGASVGLSPVSGFDGHIPALPVTVFNIHTSLSIANAKQVIARIRFNPGTGLSRWETINFEC